MSLINDALRRAAEAQKQGPPNSPPSLPLQPVDYSTSPNPLYKPLVVLALLPLVGVAVWAFSKWWDTSRQAGVATNRLVAQNLPASGMTVDAMAPAQDPTPAPLIMISTNTAVRSGSSALSAAAATPPVETKAVETPPAKTNTADASTNGPQAFPQLKLQSIIYRLNKPAVVIDGEMLHVGDVIKEARVVKIERYTVTVEWKDQTRELSLPRL